MRIGFVLSAGGSAFHEALRELPAGRLGDFVAITDRPCGAEQRADTLGISRVRVSGGDRHARSLAMLREAERLRLDALIFMYDRLVTADLFERIPCINIHPSRLPDYPGLDATARAMAAGAGVIGCTAHLIDAGIDTGPILAQVSAPVPPGADLAWAEHQAFLQKAELTRRILEAMVGLPRPLTAEVLLDCLRRQPVRAAE